MNIAHIIENIYKLTPSNIDGQIEHCNCGCCSHINFKRLKSLNRRKIDFITLGKYADKSITTIGTVDNYLYFLPRICEMILEEKINTSLYNCLISKLEYSGFENLNLQLRYWLILFLKELSKLDNFEVKSEFNEINKFIKKYEKTLHK